MIKNRTAQLIFQTIYCTLGLVGIIASLGIFDNINAIRWDFYVHFTNLSNFLGTLNNTVRTDAAIVDFLVDDIDAVLLRVFTHNVFKKTRAEIWEMHDLIRDINNGKCLIEFIYQYRTHFEQMWHCAIRSKKKPYYRECQLHLPSAEATFYWNNLRPDCEW